MLKFKNGTIILFFSILLITGCVTSKRSDLIRENLKNSAIKDLKSAISEIKEVIKRDLEKETIEKNTAIEKQYKEVLDELKTKDVDSSEILVIATDQYMKERERIRLELLTKADFYTNILIKINNGCISIETLERMNKTTEEIKENLLVEAITKDLPVVIAPLYDGGKIDQDFLNIISQYFKYSDEN